MWWVELNSRQFLHCCATNRHGIPNSFSSHGRTLVVGIVTMKPKCLSAGDFSLYLEPGVKHCHVVVMLLNIEMKLIDHVSVIEPIELNESRPRAP